MRFTLSFMLLLLITLCHGQRKLYSGQVINEQKLEIPSVHIQNLTSEKLTVSDIDGRFHLFVQSGDTLLLTSIGFEDLQVIISDKTSRNEIVLTLKELSLELAEVEVSSLPSIEEFKQQILAYQPKDTVDFWYYGVEKPVIKGDKMLDEKYKNPLYALLNPTSFLHYSFSKKEKEKRKYHELTKMQSVKDRAYEKFTREWVKDETGLEGDELTSFIAFCNFDIHYIDKTPLFVLKGVMMAKLDTFINGGKG